MSFDGKVYLLRLLKHRDYSYSELTEKLCSRGLSVGEAQLIIDDLCATNYVNDSRYAENLCMHYRNDLNYGKLKIAFCLKKKKFSEELINQLLDNYSSEVEIAFAEKIFQKKYFNYLTADNKTESSSAELYKVLKSAYTYLVNKGFAIEIVNSVLDAYRDNLASLPMFLYD